METSDALTATTLFQNIAKKSYVLDLCCYTCDFRFKARKIILGAGLIKIRGFNCNNNLKHSNKRREVNGKNGGK
tara:strand:+ start:299 stop:520 length:222 start_codon:yes stop_codon:yes gene_type:complete